MPAIDAQPAAAIDATSATKGETSGRARVIIGSPPPLQAEGDPADGGARPARRRAGAAARRVAVEDGEPDGAEDPRAAGGERDVGDRRRRARGVVRAGRAGLARIRRAQTLGLVAL